MCCGCVNEENLMMNYAVQASFEINTEKRQAMTKARKLMKKAEADYLKGSNMFLNEKKSKPAQALIEKSLAEVDLSYHEYGIAMSKDEERKDVREALKIYMAKKVRGGKMQFWAKFRGKKGQIPNLQDGVDLSESRLLNGSDESEDDEDEEEGEKRLQSLVDAAKNGSPFPYCLQEQNDIARFSSKREEQREKEIEMQLLNNEIGATISGSN